MSAGTLGTTRSGAPTSASAWEPTARVGDQVGVPSVLMRGGTSKGAILHARDLPPDREARDRVLLAIYGSPDPRQIDGIGGAHPLSSKAAIVGVSDREDADIDYLFGQVRVGEAVVDYDGTCGNMLAAVGPFAIDEGLVSAVEPVTRVRIHLVNTGQIVEADVQVRDGHALTAGSTQIAGLLGTGASVLLDFVRTGGTLGRGVLPTRLAFGRTIVSGGRPYGRSIVDAGNAVVFAAADELGLSPAELLADAYPPELMATLEQIRAEGAVELGLVDEAHKARAITPALPKLYLVRASADFVDRSGRPVTANEHDILARGLSMGRPHPAYAVTAAVCTATAARIPGTVVEQRARRTPSVVRIGHPGGVTSVEIQVDTTNAEEPRLVRACVERTARRLMSGLALVPASVLDEPAAS